MRQGAAAAERHDGRGRLWLWLGLSIAISAVMLWLAIRGVDLTEVTRVLGEADGAWVILGTLLMLVVYPVTAARWRHIARDLDPPGALVMTQLVLAGAATTNALPGRLGEPARALGLARLTRKPFLQAFGTVIVDRIADVVIACACVLITFRAVAHPAWVSWFTWIGAVVAGLGLVLLVVAGRRTRSSRSDGPPSPLRRHLSVLGVGLRSLADIRIITIVAVTTLAGWFTWACGAWMMARAVDIELTATAVIFTFGVLALGSAIPSAPGFVGTYHWIAASALQLFGVSAANSLAFAVLLHAAWFIPTTIAGLVAMIRLGLDFTAIRQARSTPTHVSRHD